MLSSRNSLSDAGNVPTSVDTAASLQKNVAAIAGVYCVICLPTALMVLKVLFGVCILASVATSCLLISVGLLRGSRTAYIAAIMLDAFGAFVLPWSAICDVVEARHGESYMFILPSVIVLMALISLINLAIGDTVKWLFGRTRGAGS